MARGFICLNKIIQITMMILAIKAAIRDFGDYINRRLNQNNLRLKMNQKQLK